MRAITITKCFLAMVWYLGADLGGWLYDKLVRILPDWRDAAETGGLTLVAGSFVVMLVIVSWLIA